MPSDNPFNAGDPMSASSSSSPKKRAKGGGRVSDLGDQTKAPQPKPSGGLPDFEDEFTNEPELNPDIASPNRKPYSSPSEDGPLSTSESEELRDMLFGDHAGGIKASDQADYLRRRLPSQ